MKRETTTETKERKPRTVNPVTTAVREWETAKRESERLRVAAVVANNRAQELTRQHSDAQKITDTAWAKLQELQGVK